ncbi:hypothetical protein Syun_012279 [Stephania yunnanensis]|uniref:DUF632 domain-containing protein n=1 Tax=Stephania yunnanensis TaxID=152371 RepID=A0AAP0JZX5_9MAGN
MGCTASKLDNEDTVRRCKERRRLMKDAVYARHHLAAAHSDYIRSLRLTGSALYEFASGEPLWVSDQTLPPSALLRNPSSLSSLSYRSVPPLQQPQPQPPPPPPPPPLSRLSPSPSLNPSRRSQRTYFSESSPGTTPCQKPTGKYNFPVNSTYASTPSQSSSAWNWENFYPPSPPGSDFYRRSKEEEEEEHNYQHHHLDPDDDEDDVDGETTEREEVHCREWGDHYSTTTSSSSDTKSGNEEEELELEDVESRRSEMGMRSDLGSCSYNEEEARSLKSSLHRHPLGKPEKSSEVGGSTSVSWNAGGDMTRELKMVVRHRDLAEIAAAIKDYFEKAADAGEQVSELLETGRAQLDRSFRQLKKTVYHSSNVFSNLSSSWTSKPPLAIKYRLDAGSMDEPGGGPIGHCSTLDRLFAWEKKLYEEVKAREGTNIECQKKLSLLQSQEYKGEDEVKLDKTKTSIKKLQSLIVVTSQAVASTSSAIIHVRDTELSPQLVNLCHGFMYMWKSMNQFHEVQNHIVQQVRGLVNRAAKEDSTSDLHRQATRHFESTVSAWHSSFCRLIKFQRDYIRSIHGWLKLTLVHVSNENNIGGRDPSVVQSSSGLFLFVDEWKQSLDRLPDAVASEAIKSFVNVVHVISVKQSEELKVKKRTETASKELEKKASSLRNIEKKYYHSYSMVGIGPPDGGGSIGQQVLDARDPLAEKKLELAGCQRRVEDEMSRHTKAVEVTRAMTLNNIQTGLPGVFQAMTDFSGMFAAALEGSCTRSYSIK